VNDSYPSVSILISVFGQADKLKKCLSCVENTLAGKLNYEILLVDDFSRDETTDLLKSLARFHRVFFNSKNRGFAVNNNLMAKYAKGEYLCLLNSDAYVEGDWLSPMLKILQTKDKVGFVGNVQKLVGSLAYDHMGVVFGPQGNPRHFGQGFLINPFTVTQRKWSAVTAACSLVKRETFIAFGGFDESFINGCEDVDLCIRMTRAGFSHHVAHRSVIKHVKGASDGRKKYNKRNYSILMAKWGDSIREIESVNDQKLHSITYLHRCFFYPHSANLSAFIDALKIFLGLKKLPALKNPKVARKLALSSSSTAKTIPA